MPVATWRYDLQQDDRGATVLTESVRDQRRRLLRLVSPAITGTRDRTARNTATMRGTLERIKVAAESS
jgi:hypothetical protein